MGAAAIYPTISPAAAPAVAPKKELRNAASDLVADMFFAPLLAEMRKLPFGRKFSHGGRGEEVFGEQLDARLSASLARTDPGGLVSQLEQSIRGDLRFKKDAEGKP